MTLAGHEGNRLYSSFVLELPIPYYEEKSAPIMDGMDQSYRLPFLKVKITSTNIRRRAIPGHGPMPDKSSEGDISEVKFYLLILDKIKMCNNLLGGF